MKRWIIGPFTFLLSLVIGLFATGLFLSDRSQTREQIPQHEPITNVSSNDRSKEESFEIIPDSEIDLIEPAPRLKIIETGESFHDDEISAKNGENWLGLFSNSAESILKLSRVSVRRVYDGIVDDDPSVKTGKSVSVREKNPPLFLLKGDTRLKPGIVNTIFRGLTYPELYSDENLIDPIPDQSVTQLNKDFRKQFDLGGISYELKVIRAITPEGKRILALILETPLKRQVLHTMRTSYEGSRGDAEWLGRTGSLFWIGDLDGDQKPDFYLSLFVHDNVGNHVLLLSSKAKPGQIVGIAGQFWTTGC